MISQRLMALAVEARAEGDPHVSAMLMALAAIVARREAPREPEPAVTFSAVGEGPALVYVFHATDAHRFVLAEVSALVPAKGAEVDADLDPANPSRLFRVTDSKGVDVVVSPESFDAFTRHLSARGVSFGETYAFVDALPTGDAVLAQLPWMRGG